jgi:aspartyl-tRNA(Asn)/glutamyl-tRNA(Gln) amidotransferase subunit B
MPEPDIPPLELDDGFMEKVKSNLPELPPAIREKLNAIRIEPKVIEDILDRPAMVKPVLEILAKAGGEPARRAVFWLLQSQPISEEPETGPEPELKFDTSRIIELSELVEAGQLSSTAARQVFEALFESAKSPRRLAEELKLLQLSDEAEIDRIVSQVLAENSKVAEEIKAGETKAVGFLVGQVMAKSRGQANPQLAQAIIKKQLGL